MCWGVNEVEGPSVADEDLADMNAPVMVLDELDSGVGGRLGTPVGRMLQAYGAGRPIGCISDPMCLAPAAGEFDSSQ